MLYRMLPVVVVALALFAATALLAQDPRDLPDPPAQPAPEPAPAPADEPDGAEGAEQEDEAGEEQGEAEADEVPEVATLNRVVPNFTLVDQDGNEGSLSDYRGKIIVIEWINWRCPYCVMHFRERTQTRLRERFADANPGVVYIAVNSSRWSTPEHNREGLAQWEGLNIRVFSDPTGAVGRKFQARTTPHMMVIDASFKLRYTGAFDSDPNVRRDPDGERTNYVIEAIQQILDNKEVATQSTNPYGCRVQYARDGRRAN